MGIAVILTATTSTVIDSANALAKRERRRRRFRRRSRAPHGRCALALLAALIFAGCQESTGPETRATNLPPRIVAVSPLADRPVVVLGETMVFMVDAEDPEGDALDYVFSLDDSLVASTDRMTFRPEAVGNPCLTAVVSDGFLSDSHVWYPRCIPEPDSIAPAVVEVLSVGPGVEPGTLRVSWVAVGDDSLEGRPARYLVRSYHLPIVKEDLWSRATPHSAPEPAAPGQPMGMVITCPGFARYASVAIRAEDEAGNLSPIGVPAGGYTRGLHISGEVLDPATGAAIPGAYVSLGVLATRSDENGRWELAEVSDLGTTLIVSDDGTAGVIGDYYDVTFSNLGENNAFYHALLLPDGPLSSTLYAGFLQYFTSITTLPGLTYPSYQRHWALPIDIHVPPFEKGGLDYTAVIQGVIAEIESSLGRDVFRSVSESPSVGVSCCYRTGIPRDYYRRDELSAEENPIRGTVAFRTVYTAASENTFARVVRHELGHVLGLHHSIDNSHMMLGGVSAPRVDRFASEELLTIRLIYGFPPNSVFDFGRFVND
jgi:hypothetical protein